MKYLYTLLIFLLFAFHNQATAQCSTSVPNFVTGGSAGSAIPYADSYVQTFKPTCNSVLTTIVFPTLWNSTDDFRGSGYFVTCIIKDASGNILATAPRTDQWYPGGTVTYDFTCFNINFTANTTYQFELKDGDANGVPLPKVYLLRRSNTASVYADGFCTIDGVAFPNNDLYGWTVNSGQNIIASATTTQTQNVTTCSRFANPSTTLLVFVNPVAPNAISGNTTAKVWIETTQSTQFVKRHYEITPVANATTATGKVTLYFTQQEFTDFNAVNVSKLPTGPTDAAGIGNLIIEKLPGSSSNGTGLPNTYTGTPVTINPADADIVWNAGASRWEVSFDITGFGGFFVKSVTSPPTITASAISGAFSACAGTASTTQTFTVSGNNLTANIVVTAPTGYEVSTAAGSGFVNSVTLTQSGGTVSNTTIYARLTNSATGSPSGNITLTSTGATTQNVAVSGTVNALPSITLGSVSNITTTATTFSLPFTATTSKPNQYSITAGTPTAMSGFSAVSNVSLSGGSPLSVTVPASAANTYNFVATVRNSTTGCVSANNNFTVTVAVVPTPFITRWDLSKSTGSGDDRITFGIDASGPVSYTWQQVGGSGLSGSSTFTNSPVIITGLPTGGIIDLSINPTNFQRIHIDFGVDRNRLIQLKQWGTVAWKNMQNAFAGCRNFTLTATDVPNLTGVTNMSAMFFDCSIFNQVLSEGFNTSAVTDMSFMFGSCSAYNQALPSSFNTAAVTDMRNMFNGATSFNQNVGNFNISAITTMTDIFLNSGISVANYDAILTAWNTAGYTSKNLGDASPLQYCASAANRANLVKTVANGGKGWTITGDKGCTTTTLTSSQNPASSGSSVTFTATVLHNTATGTVTFKDGTTTLGTGTLSAGQATFATTTLPVGTRSITAVYNGDAANATSTSTMLSQVVIDPNTLFITRWDLSKTGSINTQISFGVETSGTVNYTWQQVGGSGLSGSGTFTGTTATITGLPTGGIIDLSISPTNFQRININFGTDKSRLTQLKQWGTVAWTSMQTAFTGCDNFTLLATDVPNLTGVTNMSSMFSSCSIFNQALPEGFNTAAVTNMSSMFFACIAYNQVLPNSFNTSNVTFMSGMFSNCSAYNKALPNVSFNTAKVTDMSNMFFLCSAYNQILPNSFITNAVTEMETMFANCITYNQPLPVSFNTVKVNNMIGLFSTCTAYNQAFPSSFTTAAATKIRYMFFRCTAFNQNVGNLDITAATDMVEIFNNSGISVANYDAILTAWNTAGYTNKNLGDASPLKYCASEADRANLVKPIADGGRGWTITGDAKFCAVPTIVVTGTTTPFSACDGTSSAIQSFTVSGTNLTADIVIGKLTGFQVSLTAGTTFENTLTLPQSGGTVPTTTIYVRMSRLATGSPSGNIPITSTGATTQNVAVSGTVKPLPVLNPSSNSPVCSGQTLFLYAKGENQSGVPSTETYTWTGVNSFTANTQNPFIGNVGMNANGVYTVSATNSANCSATASIRVTVKETPTLLISNFTNPTPENNPDGTISFTTNLPNSVFSLSYGSTGSPRNVTVNSGAFTLSGLVSGVYGNFAVTNDGCTGRNNTEVTLLSTPFTLVKSITTGNWEAITTWNVGRVPKAGDVVIIDGGHTVTINANSTIKDMEVRGRLIYGVVGVIINLGF
jgi:Mycoplasma protein of unknown function, DUF285/Bacterial Ig-like domain (group 3)